MSPTITNLKSLLVADCHIQLGLADLAVLLDKTALESRERESRLKSGLAVKSWTDSKITKTVPIRSSNDDIENSPDDPCK